jgi:cell wall-associated NlpC family hydrolase
MSRKFGLNIVRGIIAFALAFQVVAIQSVEASVAPTNVVAVTKVAAKTPLRYTAMRWAKTQAGKPYCYGGEGSRTRNASCYDCSGLVQTAYAHAGISLPRTTGDFWNGNSHVRRITAAEARWGDIVMASAGHMELKSAKKGLMFGAHHSGTRIGFKSIYGSPRYYRVIK